MITSIRTLPPDEVRTLLANALRDRYAVEHLLGEGSASLAFLARDLRDESRVSLKVWRHPTGTNAAFRFLRNMPLYQQLDHPNIQHVHDFGEANGLLYYALDYVDGEPLTQRLRRGRHLGVRDALTIARDIALALGHAHDRHVGHRRVTPGNIMTSRAGAILSDFVVRPFDMGPDRAEDSDAYFYLSPEQCAGLQLDGRSDTYALGCVLFRMLTGHPPHDGPTILSVIEKRITEPPEPPSRRQPDIPPSADAVVLRALATKADDRFQTAATLAAALAAELD